MTITEQKILLYNNLEFILLDMSEMCRKQKNDIAKRIGWSDNKDVLKLANDFTDCKRTFKRLSLPYKSLIFALTDYVAIVRKTEFDTQEQFGDDSDTLLKLILTAIDRSGDDSQEMENIIEEIKKKPSKLGIV